MRYLTRQFALGSLRRGEGIEQFLGGTEVDGQAAVRWVAITPMYGQYRVSLHTVQDLGFGKPTELWESLSLDPIDEAYIGEGRELGTSTDEDAAVLLAERLTSATSNRWVNYAMAEDDYIDYVRSRQNTTQKA